jgi:hypothetical protein
VVELRFLLKDLGKYQSEEQLHEIMDEMDEGGNGAPLAPHAPARGRDLAVSPFALAHALSTLLASPLQAPSSCASC